MFTARYGLDIYHLAVCVFSNPFIPFKVKLQVTISARSISHAVGIVVIMEPVLVATAAMSCVGNWRCSSTHYSPWH